MSTPTDADRVTLHIAGHVHGDWLKYSIDSDFFTPADGWSVSFGTPATALPEYLQPWAEVQIRVVIRRVGGLEGPLNSVRVRPGVPAA